MASTFFNQGKLMNLSVGAFDIPVAFLQVRRADRQTGTRALPRRRRALSSPTHSQSFDVVIILVMVPIFDRYLYPYLKSKGLRLTMLVRA